VKGLFFIYLATAIGAIGAFRNPVIGLFVYIGFAVLRPTALWGWAGNLDGISQIVGVATLVSWALQGFGSWRIGRGRPIVVALLVFTVWNCLSAVQATSTDYAFGWVIELFKIVLPFLVGVTMMNSEKVARGMLWMIVLIQGYIAYEMNGSYYFYGYNRAQDSGFGGMDGPSFGIALLVTLGPAVALGIAAKKWHERLLAGAAAILILHTTLLTFSRGAMLGLIATAFAAFVIMPKRPKHLGILLLVVLLGLRLTGPELVARFQSSFEASDDRDSSAESRVDLWIDCLKVVESAPFFGVGPHNFPVVAASLGWSEGKEAHSVWMQTAAETGIPGVLALLLFYAFAVVRLWPIAKAPWTDENRYAAASAAGIIISLTGFAVSAQFVSLTGLETPYYITMLAVVVLKTTKLEPSRRTAVNFAARPFAYPPPLTAPLGRAPFAAKH